MINDPRISVCTYPNHVAIGCFNGLAGECVGDFIEYPRCDEEKGIQEAIEFFKDFTDITPTVIRPTITKMKKVYSKRK